jgi:predicted ArsR family transcriptional regulator
MDKLLAARKPKVLEGYRAQVPAGGTLGARVRALAAARTSEGYMAEAKRVASGEYLLVENHCPICAAAAACQGLCAIELETFRELLGDGVKIERTEHIQAGARRCAYRISAAH